MPASRVYLNSLFEPHYSRRDEPVTGLSESRNPLRRPLPVSPVLTSLQTPPHSRLPAKLVDIQEIHKEPSALWRRARKKVHAPWAPADI